MSLYLEINSNENHDFFVLYDNLSPLRQKIWNKIVQLSRRWTTVKPSQTQIAKWCGCSRSAISEAFRLFQDYGWLHLQSRGWKKSKKILIPLSKQQLDVVERTYFREVRATYRATHTIITKKENTSKEKTGDIAIRHQLKDKEIPLDAKLKLSMISEATYQEGLFQCQKKSKKGFRPLDPPRYLAATCIAIAQRKNERIDWKSYYSTLNKIKKENITA